MAVTVSAAIHCGRNTSEGFAKRGKVAATGELHNLSPIASLILIVHQADHTQNMAKKEVELSQARAQLIEDENEHQAKVPIRFSICHRNITDIGL